MTFVLDATTRALKITIDAGAGADVQFVATYADSTSTTFTKGSSQGASNGSTAVDVVPAPVASTRRVVKAISFYNANATDPRTVTFYYDDNGTAYTIAKFTLQAGQSWYSETASTEEKGATILDATNRSIQFSIDVAGSDVQYTAAWADSTDTAFTQGSSRGLSNGTSAVTIVGAPAASTRRLVQSLTFYNAHASSTRVVTLFYDDNGTARTIAKFSLLAGESWFSEVATFGFQPAGSVLAAPAATAGPPSFRVLSLTDLATVTGSGSVVLQTSPTIITPRIGEIRAATTPFRAVLSFVQAANSANYLQLTNAATGTGLGPILETIGTGADINFELKSKGTGNIVVTTAGFNVKPLDSTVSGVLTILGGSGTSAGGQLVIRTNGTNEIGFRAPDGLAASVYYVLPAADGTSGQVLSTNGSGVLSWTAGGGAGTITLSGDVTGSGTTTISTTIANDAVTFAKMQNVTSGNLLGRTTASTGDIEQIVPGTGVLAWLQTPTSANLATAITDETGTGALVFGTSPTLTTPRIAVIHTASSPNNAALGFAQVASSVNYLQITNAATGQYPILEAIGTDTDIGMVLKTKGTGYLQLDADRIETFGGDLFIYDNRSLVLFETSNVDFISIGAPSSLSVSTSYTLPANAGSSGQFLTTNGTGTLSWSNQTTTLSGDVTGSGTTAITTTIANNAVTFPKFRQIDTDTLVGRDTALTGNVEMIAVTGGIEFSGSGSIRTTAFTGDVTKTAGGTALTIANDAVTYAKMQNLAATSRVLGRKSSGSGDPEECTLSEVLDFVGTPAQGDLLYRGASTWTRLAAGTSGRVLQTKGAGANPEWAPAREVLTAARTYYVGFSLGSVTANATTDKIEKTAHGLENGDPVAFNAATAPSGITLGTIYYVRNKTADNFEIFTAATGGTQVTWTTNGSTVTCHTGNDNNSGIGTNGRSVALLTIQKAIDLAGALDSSIYDVTIQVCDGLHLTSTTIVPKTMVGAGAIIIVGNTTTPANVIVRITVNANLFAAADVLTAYQLRGFNFQTSATFTGANTAIRAQNSSLTVGLCHFTSGGGSFNNLFISAFGGYIEINDDLTFAVTGATSSIRCSDNGFLQISKLVTGVIVTISGAPATGTNFILAARGGIVAHDALSTYNGNFAASAAPTKRAELNAIILNGLRTGTAFTVSTATGGQVV